MFRHTSSLTGFERRAVAGLTGALELTRSLAQQSITAALPQAVAAPSTAPTDEAPTEQATTDQADAEVAGSGHHARD